MTLEAWQTVRQELADISLGRFAELHTSVGSHKGDNISPTIIKNILGAIFQINNINNIQNS